MNRNILIYFVKLLMEFNNTDMALWISRFVIKNLILISKVIFHFLKLIFFVMFRSTLQI